MELLYLPPSLRHFEPLQRPEAHGAAPGPLEYDLVEALRPRLCVDVGAGDASAFFSLCQSARDHDVDGMFYAVDAWTDDAEREQASLSTSASINNLLHTHFRGVAYLMRMNEKNALIHFQEASIDLLRVDPARCTETPTDLLAQWLPRLSPGGVLLVPEVSRSEVSRTAFRDATGGAGLIFPLPSGMGVFRSPPRPDSGAPERDLLRLLTSGTDGERATLGELYAHAVRHHVLRRDVRDQGAGLFRKKA